MLNHAYTLLMNLNGTETPTFSTPGDEAISPGFKTISLPTYLETIRANLFGSDPDRLMLNFRTRQCLSVLHASPLHEHVLAIDARITYDFKDTIFVEEAVFTPEIIRLSGVDGDNLSVIGRPAAPDVLGRTRNLYLVEVVDPVNVRVVRQSPPIQNVLFDFAPMLIIPLAGSGYSFRLATDTTSQSWRVEVINRPQFDTGQLTANLAAIGEPVLNSLFGITNVEPYSTFRNMWFHAKETPLRIAGFLAAYLYRLEERRLNGA